MRLFEGLIGCIKIGKRKGSGGKLLRLMVGNRELKFGSQLGQISGATDPLSLSMLPELLAKLRAAGL
ncbi:hypothetical protein FNU79_14390 [Deinococcus detaillensis]|uniref:Uncharacterized protein n=1 Tax=Deinococcus detaillensis TaxID=2592048 RepID=A0A553UPE0_9DEIO|nr:hypothetical protein [Deinococcus detaillensis]TSA82077.1 hypothetical protein FNU79_14390 [Deinococcus detaillensis]